MTSACSPPNQESDQVSSTDKSAKQPVVKQNKVKGFVSGVEDQGLIGVVQEEIGTVKLDVGHKLMACRFCSKEYSRLEMLIKHMQKVHKNPAVTQPFKCPQCEKEYTDKSALKKHMKNHASDNSKLCVDCGATFSSDFKLKVHFRNTHTTIICNRKDCGFEGTPPEVEKHRHSKHRSGKASVNKQCHICGKVFTSRSGHYEHMLKHRKLEEAEQEQEEPAQDLALQDPVTADQPPSPAQPASVPTQAPATGHPLPVPDHQFSPAGLLLSQQPNASVLYSQLPPTGLLFSQQHSHQPMPSLLHSQHVSHQNSQQFFSTPSATSSQYMTLYPALPSYHQSQSNSMQYAPNIQLLPADEGQFEIPWNSY